MVIISQIALRGIDRASFPAVPGLQSSILSGERALEARHSGFIMTVETDYWDCLKILEKLNRMMSTQLKNLKKFCLVVVKMTGFINVGPTD